MKHKKLTRLIIFVLCLNIYPLFGQGYKPHNLEIGISPHFTQAINSDIDSKFGLGLGIIYWRDIKIGETDSLYKTWINKEHHILTNIAYNYPLWGLYADYKYNESRQVGNIIAAGITSDIGFWQRNKNYFSLRPKGGLSYHEQKYNSITNSLYKSIGSHINLNLGLGFFYTLQEPINTLKIGIEANHYSNSSLMKPNTGLNLYSINFSYQFGPILFPWNDDERKNLQQLARSFPDTAKLEFQLSGGIKQYNIESEHKAVSTFQINYSSPINLYLNIKTGLIINFDESRKNEMREIHQSNVAHNFRIGFGIGPSIQFHRLELWMAPGIYLLKPEKKLDSLIFQQYQLNYRINKKFSTFAGLIIHGTEADFGHMGVSLKI